jgi:DNA polymerase I
MNGIEFEAGEEKGGVVGTKNFSLFEATEPNFRAGAFDLETYSPGRFSDPKKDPILMASFVAGKKSVVLSYGKSFSSKKARLFENEAGVIEGLAGEIREAGLDVLATYNGDLFDFPYVKERASRLGKKFEISSDGSEPREQSKGRDNAVKLAGIQHLDVYQMLRFLSRFSVVSLIKFDLESVVARLFGIEKEKVAAEEINAAWDADKNVDRVAEYCAEDSEYTLRIAEQYLPLLVELCRIVKQPLFDVGRASASMLVEYLLMDKCRETGRLIANKPDEAAIQQRLMNPIKGGYVKEPESGLHENLAVLDFSSLYPTIMISHNVSPDSLGCKHEKCVLENSAPNRQWFCLEKKGIVPEILKSLFEKRMEIKRQAKALDKKDKRFVLLNARQHALKILLNSFYGYLGYSRSRFYSRECASAITAWARQYVQWVGSEAEKAGFGLLYMDTDSAFLIIPKEKKQQDVSDFVEKINKQLPGVMNLELEGFFKRGIFVTKESGEGAKKKYALIDYNGNLKIVGFEYVRRDWSRIAKETQRNVIITVLSEGRPEKAIEIVRKTISDLREGKVKNSELVVLTQIKRKLDNYDAIGPHVAAAKKAVVKGQEIGVGSVVSYIVTKCGKSISDKAQLQEYVAEGNYDADYYIEHQVVPAVIKVMRELGYSKEDLIQGGKQHKLSSFF